MVFDTPRAPVHPTLPEVCARVRLHTRRKKDATRHTRQTHTHDGPARIFRPASPQPVDSGCQTRQPSMPNQNPEPREYPHDHPHDPSSITSASRLSCIEGLARMRSRGHSPRGVVGSMVGVQHGAAAWHKVCCRLCMTLASVTRQGSAMSSRIRVRVEQGGLAIGFGYNCHTSAALGLCVPHACRYCC